MSPIELVQLLLLFLYWRIDLDLGVRFDLLGSLRPSRTSALRSCDEYLYLISLISPSRSKSSFSMDMNGGIYEFQDIVDKALLVPRLKFPTTVCFT